MVGQIFDLQIEGISFCVAVCPGSHLSEHHLHIRLVLLPDTWVFVAEYCLDTSFLPDWSANIFIFRISCSVELNTEILEAWHLCAVLEPIRLPKKIPMDT